MILDAISEVNLDLISDVVTDAVTDAFFPPACPVCGKPLGYIADCSCESEKDKTGKGKTGKYKREKIHAWCRHKFVYNEDPKCMKCGKHLENNEKEYCHDCEKKKHEFSKGAALYAYTDGIKNSIYRFKYKNKREYASFYGFEMSEILGREIMSWDADVIIPVPLHSSKYRVRGYNQAELIAKALSLELKKRQGVSIEVDSEVLTRDRKTIPMKKLNDEERTKNLENAFNINNNIVKYNKVLLVDDIYTTGATIDACATALKQAGVQEVYYVSLCIGKGF